MKYSLLKYFALASLLCFFLVGCKNDSNKSAVKLNGTLKVVTTTTMITDLLQEIGGDRIELQGLMGSGVDPHLYKASEGDVSKLYEADIIFYNGLHLEGKLVDVFEKMDQQGKTTVALSDALDKKSLIGSEYFASNYDPHIWFYIYYWEQMASLASESLINADPENKDYYNQNLRDYLNKLNILKDQVEDIISVLPAEKRILVTAHDAFNYFGRSYDFNVVGLQGISTATEAGVKDVQRMTDFIIENDVKAIFVESSVPRRTVEALQESVRAKGKDIKIGGELYSDALGTKGTDEGTYIGMYLHNVKTIVNALK